MQTDSTGEDAPATSSAGGIITRSSPYPVDVIADRIEAVLRARRLTRFALVDHSGEAARVGPTIGLPSSCSSAVRPPAHPSWSRASSGMRLAAGSARLAGCHRAVLVSYNSTAYLAARHHLPDNLLPNIAGIDSLIANTLATDEVRHANR